MYWIVCTNANTYDIRDIWRVVFGIFVLFFDVFLVFKDNIYMVIYKNEIWNIDLSEDLPSAWMDKDKDNEYWDICTIDFETDYSTAMTVLHYFGSSVRSCSTYGILISFRVLSTPSVRPSTTHGFASIAMASVGHTGARHFYVLQLISDFCRDRIQVNTWIGGSNLGSFEGFELGSLHFQAESFFIGLHLLLFDLIGL